MEHTADHDILIEIKTETKNLKEEVRLMRDNTKDDIKNLSINKLDVSDFVDYKGSAKQQIVDMQLNYTTTINGISNSVDALRRQVDGIIYKMALISGACATLAFIAPYIINYFVNK